MRILRIAIIGIVLAGMFTGVGIAGDYYDMDYPERITAPKINDYNPPDYYDRDANCNGRERISYLDFCMQEREKFEIMLGYERAHTHK